MKPLTSTTLKGTWSTLLLPLDDQENIQWPLIDDQLTALAAADVDGIYFNGTACEFFSQSDEEFLRLARTTASFCEDRSIPFQIGASHAHATQSLKRIEQTRELNPGAFQIILPEWTPLAWDEILNYLRRIIATAAPVPIVIYNPPTARKVLTPQEWHPLGKEFDEIIGIKVAGGDKAWYNEMQDAADFLSVFVAGVRLGSGIINGCASGSYSNLACLTPQGAVDWYQRILSNPQMALEQESQILNVFGKTIAPFRGVFSNSALDKALASAGAWTGISSRVRWPLASIAESDVQLLSTQFREGLPFLFEETIT